MLVKSEVPDLEIKISGFGNLKFRFRKPEVPVLGEYEEGVQICQDFII
jgi:hypothetical protein